ncbi:hypothetical protein EIP91_009066 [Steccherinum ochraceum]|uniref:F-box domain-containing protein n=1 Tax=Steccherinum ochraceum TaxID=92696 RepID=A0A4R0R4R5_9APHY|nr:hypothetical protein EIP91_009066 [Steccherinum ochraceum]
MGQWFKYYNLDKKVVGPCLGKVPHYSGGKDDRYVSLLNRLINTEATPRSDVLPTWKKIIQKNRDSVHSNLPPEERLAGDLRHLKEEPLPGLLSELPAELLLPIFAALEDDYMAILCLSLANTRLYEFGYLCLLKRVQEANNWSGDRLACIGDYCFPEHVPEGIFTPAELELLNELHPTWLATEALDDIMEHSFDECDSLCVLDSVQFQQKQAKYLANLSSAEEECFRELKAAVGGPEYTSSDLVASEEHPWVLCNLTTAEYVRAEVIWRVLAEGEDEELQNIDSRYGPICEGGAALASAIAARFCWGSCDPGYDMLSAWRKLTSGTWAGHRFEVVPFASMRQLESGKQWEDVGEEVAEEIKALIAEH